VADDKLELAHKLGADLTVNAMNTDPGTYIKQETGGGVHGVLVTAVSTKAFSQAISTLRRRGTLSMTGLPPGSFDLPIFETVLNRITIRGSIVGTRKDLQECLEFAAEGKVQATVKAAPLEEINQVFDQMRKGQIDGRMVLDIAEA